MATRTSEANESLEFSVKVCIVQTMNPDVEEWRQIADFPNYSVSNLGRIRHIKRGLLGGHCNNTGYLYFNANIGFLTAKLGSTSLNPYFRGRSLFAETTKSKPTVYNSAKAQTE